MAEANASSPLRRITEQGLVPAALVLLPVLVGVLVLDARAAERSHRATAENALRDYAAFAAWQFGRHARSALSSHLNMSVAPAREIAAAPLAPLPPPSVLLGHAARCGCGFQEQIRYAYRVDLGADGSVNGVEVTEAVDQEVRNALGARLTTSAPEPLTRDAAYDGEGMRIRRGSRLRFDTLGGASYVLAYAVVGDERGAPRAIYGLAADASHVGRDFDRDIMHGQPLLPPSLIGQARNDSVLSVRISRPDGGVIYERGAPFGDDSFAAADTLDAMFGGLVTTIALRPEIAESLVIGGLPPSRLPVALALLGAAALVSVMALAQFRRARELARLRSEFVANVSHELRTPLTQISMFSETLMLDRERSPDERRHFLSVIFREARRLTNLVDGVLRFSRGEAGASRVRLEVRDLSADIRDAAEAFAPLAAAAETTVRIDLADDLHAWVDQGALRQVLLNLLDNAVKYGPAGQTVTVRATRAEDEIVVSVEDEGVGIPTAERTRVFEAFTRLDRPAAPRVSGSGIGLAVVRGLVTAHGGRVWAESGAGGRGTRAAFTLRRAEGATAGAPAPVEMAEGIAR